MTRILMELLSTPWALRPETLAAMTDIVLRWSSGVRLQAADIAAAVAGRPEARAARRDEDRAAADERGVGVLPIFGVMAHRAAAVEQVSTGADVSAERLGQRFDAMLNDPRVGAIVLDVDSPGGSVFGVPELSDQIHAARGRKPIVAVANAMAASAAYWIASAADEIVVTQSGEVGSIGVWSAHVDASEAVAREGRRYTLLSAGKYKIEGNPYEPLGDEARGALQARIDDYYGQFVRAVARNRGDTQTAVREGYGQGRVLGAQAAVKEKLADRIGTLDSVIAELSQRISTSSTSRPRAAAARRNLQIAGA